MWPDNLLVDFLQIPEQYQGRFMQGLSLPQICENLVKAAHDPRIEGVFLSIEPLECGWGKLDEIKRHMEYYKQSGMQQFLCKYSAVIFIRMFSVCCFLCARGN